MKNSRIFILACGIICSLIMGFAYIQHGLDKILSVLSKYPCDTYNEIFIQSAGYSKLPVQLCLAVYVQWFIVLTIRCPGCLPLSVKYIVCGKI